MGIISFQGARTKVKKQDNTPIKVSDYMTRNLITFSPEQSVMEVMETLIKHKISGGPVVNERNELLGIISEGDCIKQLNESRYYNMPIDDANVERFMAKNVDTIDGNISIFDAANKFLESKRRRFPILENGKLVGQISQKDVMKAALQMKGQNWRDV
ncbi:CBS domain-containing protein [Aquimarina sp. MMG015]|uniref:CBS domain-containing protein n=1 Tax=Aquimarina TaxID=290174 RepID=UPI00041185C2|nr:MULTISPECIES: CBS domain-containing protein [Aquimarina]AXT57585.1 CBS domain-containing protein [Aquimarina sp. AD1]MBQ4805195.1 CBS domain-containing protein [Aquimarina sp. MMG015]RKN35138.1 CBS domain-containing protein [Aquimarina sp. AD1]